jgi:hypothetical protein
LSPIDGATAPQSGILHRMKDCQMKLSDTMVRKTTEQIEAQALPDTHPAVPQLNSLFGEHTFFLSRDGLTIVEPADAADSGGRKGHVVQLAEWSDEQQTSLVPCEPHVTDVTIELGISNARPPKPH